MYIYNRLVRNGQTTSGAKRVIPNHDADLTALNMLARSDEVRDFQMLLVHLLCIDLPVTVGPDKAEMLGCMSLVSKDNTVGRYGLLGAPRHEDPLLYALNATGAYLLPTACCWLRS